MKIMVLASALVAGCAATAGGPAEERSSAILETPLAATAYNAGETGTASETRRRFRSGNCARVPTQSW